MACAELHLDAATTRARGVPDSKPPAAPHLERRRKASRRAQALKQHLQGCLAGTSAVYAVLACDPGMLLQYQQLMMGPAGRAAAADQPSSNGRAASTDSNHRLSHPGVPAATGGMADTAAAKDALTWGQFSNSLSITDWRRLMLRRHWACARHADLTAQPAAAVAHLDACSLLLSQLEEGAGITVLNCTHDAQIDRDAVHGAQHPAQPVRRLWRAAHNTCHARPCQARPGQTCLGREGSQRS